MRINEFKYGDTESGAFGITRDTESHFILPAQASYTKAIPGMDGVVDFGIGGYGARTISFDIYFEGDFADLRANREAIIAWLHSNAGAYKRLELGDEDGKYYMAKITSALNFANTEDVKIGTLQFMCNPPWQYEDGILLTPEEIAWNTSDLVDDNQYIKEFTASGTIRLTNTGTAPVKPIIKLINKVPAGITLTYGTKQFEFDSAILYDGLIIDCANETVTLMSDGSNQFSHVNVSKDDFFELAAGQIEITVTATGLDVWPDNLIMIVQFDPMNLG